MNCCILWILCIQTEMCSVAIWYIDVDEQKEIRFFFRCFLLGLNCEGWAKSKNATSWCWIATHLSYHTHVIFKTEYSRGRSSCMMFNLPTATWNPSSLEPVDSSQCSQLVCLTLPHRFLTVFIPFNCNWLLFKVNDFLKTKSTGSRWTASLCGFHSFT